MIKIILVSCLTLALVQAEVARNDDYIAQINYQNQRVLDEYDVELHHFEDLYIGRVEAAVLLKELISDTLIQSSERWNPFVFLGGDFKSCVAKYRSAVPTALGILNSIETCELEADDQLTDLLEKPGNTRNELEQYYQNTYANNLKECAQEYDQSSENYTLCVTSVTAFSNSFTIANKKQFEAQLEEAICTAKANIKALLSCVYTQQKLVISAISESSVLINRCFKGEDECKPCEKYTCSEKYDLEVNGTTETIKNPFFGLKDHKGCLLLNAK